MNPNNYRARSREAIKSNMIIHSLVYIYRDINKDATAYTYGIKCVGRIVTKSLSYFLHLYDFSVPYCASLVAWNWVVAGQHLNASHPRSSV